MFRKIASIAFIVTFSIASVFAQNAELRSLTAGQKYKIKGVVVSKQDDTTLIVRDTTGVDTKVMIGSNASIKSNATFGGDRFPVTAIVRGLNLELEGVGDSSGSLAASKVRFNKSNLLTAQSIDARVAPAEERLTAAEQNAQRVSGQIDELMAI